MRVLVQFRLNIVTMEGACVNRVKDMGHEASLSFGKALRLLVFRLREQGLRATGMWFLNLFSRVILDRPLRRLCEITPQIFVGGQFGVRGRRVLDAWGITAVVNMRSEFDDRAAGLAPQRYLHLPTDDDTAPTLEHLLQGVTFIREELAAGGKVYIHCASGVGRAPTMAAAYLVSTGLSIEEAWEVLRRARPFIRPTAVQRAQLRTFAAALSERAEVEVSG